MGEEGASFLFFTADDGSATADGGSEGMISTSSLSWMGDSKGA